jgi:hypothetical protein
MEGEAEYSGGGGDVYAKQGFEKKPLHSAMITLGDARSAPAFGEHPGAKG